METARKHGTEVRVRCLLVIGDQAELQVPGQDEPARWPAAAIAGQAGVTVAQLPGRELLAVLTETREHGRAFSAFRLAS